MREFEEPCCAVIKHRNPCGLAIADTLSEAFSAGMGGDPLSAYGCVLAFNRVLDTETAKAIAQVIR